MKYIRKFVEMLNQFRKCKKKKNNNLSFMNIMKNNHNHNHCQFNKK